MKFVIGLLGSALLMAASTLSGCQTTGTTGTAPAVVTSTEYTCTAAAAALKVTTSFYSKMTPTQVQTVNKAVAVLNPVCSQPTVPTLDSTAQAGLTGALSQLTSVSSILQ